MLCWTCGSTRLLLVQAAHELVAKIATQGRAAVLDVAGVEPPVRWVKITLNRPLIPLSSHWPVGPGPNLIRIRLKQHGLIPPATDNRAPHVSSPRDITLTSC